MSYAIYMYLIFLDFWPFYLTTLMLSRTEIWRLLDQIKSLWSQNLSFWIILAHISPSLQWNVIIRRSTPESLGLTKTSGMPRQGEPSTVSTFPGCELPTAQNNKIYISRIILKSILLCREQHSLSFHWHTSSWVMHLFVLWAMKTTLIYMITVTLQDNTCILISWPMHNHVSW